MVLKFKKFKFPYYNCFLNPTVWFTVLLLCNYFLMFLFASKVWQSLLVCYLCGSNKVAQYGDGGKNFLTTVPVSFHDPDSSKMNNQM